MQRLLLPGLRPSQNLPVPSRKVGPLSRPDDLPNEVQHKMQKSPKSPTQSTPPTVREEDLAASPHASPLGESGSVLLDSPQSTEHTLHIVPMPHQPRSPPTTKEEDKSCLIPQTVSLKEPIPELNDICYSNENTSEILAMPLRPSTSFEESPPTLYQENAPDSDTPTSLSGEPITELNEIPDTNESELQGVSVPQPLQSLPTSAQEAAPPSDAHVSLSEEPESESYYVSFAHEHKRQGPSMRPESQTLPLPLAQKDGPPSDARVSDIYHSFLHDMQRAPLNQSSQISPAVIHVEDKPPLTQRHVSSSVEPGPEIILHSPTQAQADRPPTPTVTTSRNPDAHGTKEENTLPSDPEPPLSPAEEARWFASFGKYSSPTCKDPVPPPRALMLDRRSRNDFALDPTYQRRIRFAAGPSPSVVRCGSAATALGSSTHNPIDGAQAEASLDPLTAYRRRVEQNEREFRNKARGTVFWTVFTVVAFVVVLVTFCRGVKPAKLVED